jgi:hypothetical protein
MRSPGWLGVLLLLVSLGLDGCRPVDRARSGSHPGADDEEVAASLLSAIRQRDADMLRRIAGNPELFDDRTLAYLIGDAQFRFPSQPGLRSAATLLSGRQVDTSIRVLALGAGVRSLQIVYWPHGIDRGVSSRLEPFRDYIVCEVEVGEGWTSMHNACFAETDVFASQPAEGTPGAFE